MPYFFQLTLLASVHVLLTGGTSSCSMDAGKQLYDTVMSGDEAAAMGLMEGGVDVHAADFKPNEALHYKDPETGANVIFAASSKGLSQLVTKLLAADAPVNSQNTAGENCLLAAARGGHLDVVRQLLEAGADKANNASDGSTVVEVAKKGGNDAIVEMLTAKDGRNLFNAIMMKNEAEAAALIEAGADIHWTEAVYGADAILVAANRGLTDTVRILIAKGGNVNSKQSFGYTCLHTAAAGGHVEIAKQLLAAGADKTVKTNDGATALSLAEKVGQTEVAALLKD